MAFTDFISSFLPTVYAEEAAVEEVAPEVAAEAAEVVEEAFVSITETPEGIVEEEVVVEEPVEEEPVVEEEVVEEEEEEEEPEDPKEQIMEECAKECSGLKKHLDECNERVENGSSENCIEEFFHYMHCADKCAAPKIFAATK
ncbi:unnamed protein product [Cunninghamella blakesleeana]